VNRTKNHQKSEDKNPSENRDDHKHDHEDSFSQALFFDQTTEYIKDPETGRWVIVNPAGSELYNNLYREKKD
jgi:hypothetical protein